LCKYPILGVPADAIEDDADGDDGWMTIMVGEGVVVVVGMMILMMESNYNTRSFLLLAWLFSCTNRINRIFWMLLLTRSTDYYC
jgi:hypothetical protein